MEDGSTLDFTLEVTRSRASKFKGIDHYWPEHNRENYPKSDSQMSEKALPAGVPWRSPLVSFLYAYETVI